MEELLEQLIEDCSSYTQNGALANYIPELTKADPSKLGAGIAVAFVATVYGVGAANLIFIPFSTKLKFKYKKIFLKKEVIIEGILSIQAGESPALIERKLMAYILDSHMKEEAA